SAVGLGPFVSDTGAARFGHSGGNEGFRCHVLAYRDAGLGAAVMTNGDLGGYLVQRALAAIAQAYDWPNFPVVIDDPEMPDDSTLAALAGRHQLRDGVELVIKPIGSHLQVTFTGQAPMAFIFTGTNDDGCPMFVSNVTDTQLRLDGSSALTFVQNGQ